MQYRIGKYTSVSVEPVDNGWVLRWSREVEYVKEQYWSSRPEDSRPPDSGCEIFSDRKKLMKRLETILQ